MNNNFVIMPREVVFYNGCNERCDLLVGPCSCGAWHSLDDWQGHAIDGIPVIQHWSVRRAIAAGPDCRRTNK